MMTLKQLTSRPFMFIRPDDRIESDYREVLSSLDFIASFDVNERGGRFWYPAEMTSSQADGAIINELHRRWPDKYDAWGS